MPGLPSLRAVATVAAALYAFVTPGIFAQDMMSDAEATEGIDDPDSYYTDLHPCPLFCGVEPPSNWTVYTSFGRLALCDETLLFDFALYNPVSDPDTPTKIRVCTAEGGNPETRVNALFNGTGISDEILNAAAAVTSSERRQQFSRRVDDDKAAGSCGVAGILEANVSLELASRGPGSLGKDDSSVTAVLDHLQSFFQDEKSCESKFMFSYSHGVIAGLYVGPSFGRETVSAAVQGLKDSGTTSSASTVVAQLCGNGRNANHVFGLVLGSDINEVQDATKTWADAGCVAGLDVKGELEDLAIWESNTDLGMAAINETLFNSTSTTNFTRRTDEHNLVPRADCTTTTVVSGDSCAALAIRCGITPAKFTEYNTDKSLCSTLSPGQRVCCSTGTLPDIRPKPGADGTCASYTVVSGDTCSSIANNNGLKLADIEKFNNGTTWGWYGCNKLMASVNICLSTGKPPMPYPIPNAVCGPTKPGSTQPTDGTKLKDINPCPLNVCCNVWGQCGISDDFCLDKPGPSPGTSTIQNGCVSNCGHDIKNNGAGPASFQRVGYYETWNYNRACLKMSAGSANTDGSYTHIHWAFAEVNTADWTVKINDTFKQWEAFKGLPLKRIISFGGWGYSTEPGTYDILRQAMNPTNRATFAKNVAKFVNDEGIDGADFDWEYPGALDIPGTPPGMPDDGPNYLKFLTTMRSAMPASSGKTLSIAAPASYWYLKAFPIANMAKQLDYIVYMTYDLHGQWDAGNSWSIEGCPAGNCLRSHVNLTETMIALSMITKAGVATNKIFVGESSYGRSFKMSQAGCTGPMCTFTGDRLNSNAAKGVCTDTAGYISNAEIFSIISDSDRKPDSFHDALSNSDIVIYDDTEWVAYMSPATKGTRRNYYKGLNFAGTIDWAVDLQDFTDDDYDDPLTDVDDSDGDNWPEDLVPCTGSYATIEDLEQAGDSVPDHCKPRYIVAILKTIHEKSIKDYDTLVSGGYDRKFKTYADAVVNSGQKTVDKFMHDKGNDYFTCDVTEEAMSCDHCFSIYNPEKGECRYCEKYDDGWSTICDQPEVLCGPFETRYKNITGPCSPDFSLRAGPEPTDGYANSVYWKFRPGKEEEFWAVLYSEAGVKQEDVKFKTIDHYACGPTEEHCGDRNHDYNYPTVEGYTREDVLDPKTVVSEGYDDLKELGPDMGSVVDMVNNDAFPGDEADLVDALSLPVFLVKDAVKQMTDIDDTVDKWDEEKRKSIILAFLSAIFFFIPVIGQIASSISALAGIARIITVLGTLGEIATDIYTMVDDKDNIPLGILSIVLAPLAIMDAVQIGKAAAKRAEMTPNDLKALGDRISGPLNTIDNIKGKSCKLPAASLAKRMSGWPMSNLHGEQVWGWNM